MILTIVEEIMIVHTIPCLKDNYAYVLERQGLGILIDAPESDPIIAFIEAKKIKLTDILLTHHHWDHTQGVLKIKSKTNCNVFGYLQDKNRIEGITHTLVDNQNLTLNQIHFKVIHIPGHTTGQVAYWLEPEDILFPGDTLFSMGCGRLFEGSPAEMFQSLLKIKSLPKKTKIYCGHEYSLRNAEFCLKHAPNAALQKHYKHVLNQIESNLPTVPTSLELELEINPFLKANTLNEFIRLRKLRDQW